MDRRAGKIKIRASVYLSYPGFIFTHYTEPEAGDAEASSTGRLIQPPPPGWFSLRLPQLMKANILMAKKDAGVKAGSGEGR